MTAQQLPEAAVEAASEEFACHDGVAFIEFDNEAMAAAIRAFLANAPADFLLSLAERLGDEEREALTERIGHLLIRRHYHRDVLPRDAADRHDGHWPWPDAEAIVAALLPGEPRD